MTETAFAALMGVAVVLIVAFVYGLVCIRGVSRGIKELERVSKELERTWEEARKKKDSERAEETRRKADGK